MVYLISNFSFYKDDNVSSQGDDNSSQVYSEGDDNQIVPSEVAESPTTIIPNPRPTSDDSPPSDPSDPEEEEEEGNESFKDLLEFFSRQWLQTQLTHKVSLAASNSFWLLAMQNIPRIMELKNIEGHKRKIPQFMQVHELTRKFCITQKFGRD